MTQHDLSLGFLMLPDVAPPELIGVAADVGCLGVSVSAALTAASADRPSLLDDRAMRDATRRALAERSIRLDLIEGISVAPDTDLGRARAVLEVMRELGAPRFNITIWDPDTVRAGETLAGYLEIADELDMLVTLEFLRISQVPSLASAAAVVAEHPRMRILVDALHLARAGETPHDVAALDPALIGFCQICDATLPGPDDAGYMEEAMHERLVPGTGELPLGGLLGALPPTTIVALEVPMRGRARAGTPPVERARLAADGARRLLAASSPI